MAKSKATITYEVITPESAEHGDTADNGWWMPGGWHFSLTGDKREEVLQEAKDGEYDFKVGEAIVHARSLRALYEIEINGRSLTARSVEPVCDRDHYEKGEDKFYTLHIDNCSEGTLKRIKDLLES